MQRTLRQPGFWLSVGLAAIAVGCQMLLASPLEVVDIILRHGGSSPLHLARDPLVLGIINLVAFGVAIGLGLLFNRLKPRHAFPLGAVLPLAWVALPLIIFGGGVLMSEADNLFRWLVPMPEFIASLMAEMFFSPDRVVAQLLLLAVVAPVTEELLFRGIILRGMLGRFRPGAAVLLTAMLFAAMHLNPWQTITAFMLGVIFGWFYLRTGSLWLCLAGHALHNTMVVIAGAAPFGLWEPPTAADLVVVEFQPWWLDVGGAGVLALGLWIFLKGTPPTAAPAEESLPPVLDAESIPPILPV